MKTSELLVCVLVFLFGYMLFKRCGCTEGITVPINNCKCEIDDNVWKYVDEDKITKHNGESNITEEQCRNFKFLVDKQPIAMCRELGGQGTIISFGGNDISNFNQCSDVCEKQGGTWSVIGNNALCKPI